MEVSIRIFEVSIAMYQAPGIGGKPYALQGTPKTKDTLSHTRITSQIFVQITTISKSPEPGREWKIREVR